MWSSAAAGSGLVLSEVDATALASTLPLGPEIADRRPVRRAAARGG